MRRNLIVLGMGADRQFGSIDDHQEVVLGGSHDPTSMGFIWKALGDVPCV
jgi:hypothetical protein